MIASDDALAYRAVAYLGNEMLVEQSNREATLRYAIGDLRSTPPEGDVETEIDDDWLHAFIREASTKSDSEMQFLFGRILSGEIRKPGTFSIRSVRALSMMSQATAKQFEKLCSISTSLGNDVTMVVSYSGHAGDNALAKHGLSFLILSNLAENNLINNDFHTKIDLNFVEGNSSHFDYAGNVVWLSKNNTPDGKGSPKLRGPLFSKVGDNLRKIVSMKPDQMYTSGFIEYFPKFGLCSYQSNWPTRRWCSRRQALGRLKPLARSVVPPLTGSSWPASCGSP